MSMSVPSPPRSRWRTAERIEKAALAPVPQSMRLAGIRAVGSRPPEPRKRTVDDVFVPLDERLVIEIVLFEDAGAEALDDHVRLRREFGDDLFSLVAFEIDADALFAVVERDEHVAVHDVPEVVPRRGLDLDDGRTHLREHLGTDRSGDRLCEVGDCEIV